MPEVGEPKVLHLEAALVRPAGAAAPVPEATAHGQPKALHLEAALAMPEATASGEPKAIHLEAALGTQDESIWQPPAGDAHPGAWTQCWLAQYMAVAASAALCQEAAPDTLQLPAVLPSLQGTVFSGGAASDVAVVGEVPHGCLAEEELGKRLLIAQQVEYYLSDTNLRHDAFFHRLLSEAEEGWIGVDCVLSCQRMRLLGATADDVRAALKESGSKIELKQECGSTGDHKSGIFVRRPDGAPPPALEPPPAGGTTGAAGPREPGAGCPAAGGPEHAGPDLCAEAAGTLGWLGGADPWAIGLPWLGCDMGWGQGPPEAPGPARASEPAVVLRLYDALQVGPGETPAGSKRRPPSAAARPARGGGDTPSTSASDRASDAGEAAGPSTPDRRRRGKRGGRAERSPAAAAAAAAAATPPATPHPATPQKLPAAQGGLPETPPGTPAKLVTGGRRAKNGELRTPKAAPSSACQ